MPAPLRVLFVTPEALPYWKTGGLADVARSLPDALAERGLEVRIVHPYYRAVRALKLPLAQLGSAEPYWPGGAVPVRFLEHEPERGAPAVFVDARRFFDTVAPYRPPDALAVGRRFALFCRAVLAFARDWRADVIHLNDWQTGLVPAYALAEDTSVPTVFAVHNLAYQGNMPPPFIDQVGIPPELYRTENGLEFHGHASFLKGGIALSDRIVTVSPTYAREIQTPELGAGLDGLLRFRRRALSGILNGLDLDSWNPATDAAIPARFDARRLDAKELNRRALCRELGLDPRSPVLAMVSRLVHQKGIDLVLDALPALLRRGVRLVVLGDGDRRVQRALARFAAEHPRRVAAVFRFDDALARLIYAGSDFFLMPSIFEPCGLGQMIAQRYGTVPVVRRTGGLADTVIDGETGFLFGPPTARALLDAVDRSRAVWRGPDWDDLRRRCMALDRSWARSAARYEAVYRTAVGPDFDLT